MNPKVLEQRPFKHHFPLKCGERVHQLKSTRKTRPKVEHLGWCQKLLVWMTPRCRGEVMTKSSELRLETEQNGPTNL